jgi:hypothetical protein
MHTASHWLRRVATGALFWLAGAGFAHAGLVGSSVTATFSSGGAVIDTATATVSAAVEFTPVNMIYALGTNAEQERIDVDDTTISMVLMAFSNDGTSGWDADANWVFSGLDMGPGVVITGATLTGTNVTNFEPTWLTFTGPDTLTLNVGTMIFGGATMAEQIGRLTITLATQVCTDPNCDGGGGTVPEPSTLALVGLGLLATTRLRRSAAT